MYPADKNAIFHRFDQWTWDQHGWTSSTSALYLRIARAADKWLLENRKRSLWSARYDDLTAYLSTCKRTARRRNQVRDALRAFLDYLVSEGRRTDNPARTGGPEGKGLPTLKEPHKVVRSLDAETMEAVWAEAKADHPMVCALVALYFWGAIRNAEGRWLRWDQVEKDSIIIEGKGAGLRRGRGKERRVPMHGQLAWALRRWRPLCPDPVLVFPSPRIAGQPISACWIAKRVSEIGERLGIHLHPHLLRHTMATEMLDRGANIRAVQRVLGHANLSTTEIYVDVRAGREREAIEIVDFSSTSQPEDVP